MNYQRLRRAQLAARVARDVADGSYVNLGIGIPTMVADFVPEDREIVYHSENGILGFGPAPADDEDDPDLINAGKTAITLLPGGCFFHHTDSFLMIRGGHIDLSIMGALQVSMTGDLANWTTGASDFVPAVGGAMDLAVGAKKVFITMTHVTGSGEPKLLDQCTYPLTAQNVVNRVYTDLAVIDVERSGFVVREMVAGMSPGELQDLTGAPLSFDSDLVIPL